MYQMSGSDFLALDPAAAPVRGRTAWLAGQLRAAIAGGTLAPGDALVWLSDGLIECVNTAGEQFGYDRVRQHLAGAPTSAEHLRNRLLGAIHRHTGGLPADDDRTLVVMVYRAPVA